MERGVAPGQRPVVGGLGAELDERALPRALLPGATVPDADDGAERGPRILLLDRGEVLRGPIRDALVQQGEEEVGLAVELRVHDALREAGALGDRIEGGRGVAPLGEDLPRRGEQPVAIALHLLGSSEPGRRHPNIKYQRYPNVNGTRTGSAGPARSTSTPGRGAGSGAGRRGRARPTVLRSATLLPSANWGQRPTISWRLRSLHARAWRAAGLVEVQREPAGVEAQQREAAGVLLARGDLLHA